MTLVSQDTFRAPMMWGQVQRANAQGEAATLRGLYTQPADEDDQPGVGGADLFRR